MFKEGRPKHDGIYLCIMRNDEEPTADLTYLGLVTIHEGKSESDIDSIMAYDKLIPKLTDILKLKLKNTLKKDLCIDNTIHAGILDELPMYRFKETKTRCFKKRCSIR